MIDFQKRYPKRLIAAGYIRAPIFVTLCRGGKGLVIEHHILNLVSSVEARL